MNSSRPYLMRAVYEWIVDNNLTPYLLVNALLPEVYVPQEHVSNGKIILNIAPEAVQNLDMSGLEVSFHARFGGKPMQVHVPVAAAMAIYARENGRGMVFNDDEDNSPEPHQGSESKKDKSSGPQLRVVK
ncbi:MAG: ClpXP protease specificity-enhancing factor [Ectothiorhodospiraceae bacterium]|nr:ClpXP protease specificity-enhancing factor [Ectothiorhodospiraceae bacterium]